MTGIERRISRLLASDGRSLIVAFDHGIYGMNYSGMAKPEETLADMLPAGADAVLITVGLARRYESLLSRVGLVLNLDFAAEDAEASVREALLLGAEAAKYIFFPWNERAPEALAKTKRLAMACHEWGLPLMVETIPVSFEAKEAHTVEKIGQAARIGCELGADIIKMQYTGDQESFRAIVESLYAPVVVLGGARDGELRTLLQNVRGALDAGAIGVAIGRYIWDNERPAHVVAALSALIHGNATVDQAMRELITVL